ncbi:bifunctional metallophosphatase/5'-nucleotidase [Roseomonas sp. CCTCC AB2023176]|uniref:bifunctional metallophosphatase/5'-nucleotidase n=1 Tax=Roseomonas sp. CCTCC AB2023176 TaxID=3342640 RepID=UPI0035DAB3EE
MTTSLSRRALFGAALAAPFVRPALAQVAARIAVLHMNDFHSKHEGVAETGAVCRPDRPCLGGAARLAGAIRDARAEAAAEGRATLFLDAGDQFMGSLFYTIHRGAAEAAVQRITAPAAMSLGNHEFDNGPENLARYLELLSFPVLSANLDTGREPALNGRVAPSTIVEAGGRRIGIVGLTTPATAGSSSPGPNLRFTDPLEAAEREAFTLRRAGIGTVIVLSHLGLPEDRRLAAEVEGLDAIVGGHSHLLLANGLPGAVGPHPLVVAGKGRDVRIVQAMCHGRYLGRLDLDLAPDGRIVAHGGTVRPVDATVAEDPAVAAVVAEYAAPLGERRRHPVGQALAAFPDTECRTGECALGNLVAEAMLAASHGADVALFNGGGLRAALPAGQVTLGDVLAVLPFSNTMATMTIRGGALRAGLENGVSRLPTPAGRFPQMAGMRVVLDPDAPAGRRVREATIGGAPLDPDRAYRVVTNDFMRRGGDGYATFRDDALEAYDDGPLLEDVVADFLAERGPAAPRTDGRITRG